MKIMKSKPQQRHRNKKKKNESHEEHINPSDYFNMLSMQALYGNRNLAKYLERVRSEQKDGPPNEIHLEAIYRYNWEKPIGTRVYVTRKRLRKENNAENEVIENKGKKGRFSFLPLLLLLMLKKKRKRKQDENSKKSKKAHPLLEKYSNKDNSGGRFSP